MSGVGRKIVLALAAPVIAVVFSLALSSIVLLISGSDPLAAYWDMIANGGRLETIVDMLNRATPLYLSGLAAAIGFRMNLFNIGVEGQYILAAFAAAVVGANIILPSVFHVALIIFVAMLVGAAWSGLAGWLKVSRGINEVISTIMLNFIAIAGIIAWLAVELRDGPLTPNSGTKSIPESGHLPDLNSWLEIFTREISGGRKLSAVLLLAIVAGIIFHVFLNRTRLGFDLRASGYNPFAARVGGVPADRMGMAGPWPAWWGWSTFSVDITATTPTSPRDSVLRGSQSLFSVATMLSGWRLVRCSLPLGTSRHRSFRSRGRPPGRS